MSGLGKLYRDVTRVDRSSFSFPTGIRAGVVVTLPLLIGVATGQRELVYTTLGALFITNTEGPNTVHARLRVLLLASFSESLAFGLGTLAGTTGLAAIPLMGLGVFFALLMALYPEYAFPAMFTAIFFAVGIGLPGGSVGATEGRVVFSLLGGFWGLTGIALHRYAADRLGRHVPHGTTQNFTPIPGRPPVRWFRTDAFKQAGIVGIAAAAGISVGLALGLPRDFWIIVTIVLALRPSIGPTVDFTTMIVIGTAIGAVLAASVTLEITNGYVLWLILLGVAVCLFATRGMNLTLTQIFVTPLIIILLNIVYPGEWQLAETRILDVVIGGAIALVTSYIVQLKVPLHYRYRQTHHPVPGPPVQRAPNVE